MARRHIGPRSGAVERDGNSSAICRSRTMSCSLKMCGSLGVCDVAKVLDVEAEIYAGALGTAVTQEIPDRFEWGALAEQLDRQRVAQAVGSLVWDRKSAAPRPALERLGHSGGTERARGSADAKEDLAA